MTHIRRVWRLVKALNNDPRLPSPVRWMLRIALAIKVVPVPDLGIDEILLVIVAALLLTVYRPTLVAILQETA